MARDVDSLVVAMKAVLVPLMFQLDRAVPPMPFRDEVSAGSNVFFFKKKNGLTDI